MNGCKKHITVKLLIPVLLSALCVSAWAFEPAHNVDIDCNDCHNIHQGPLLCTGEEQADMCKTCHSPLGRASSMSDVSNHVVNDGETVVDCGCCHNPHYRMSPVPNPSYPEDYNLSLVRTDMGKYVQGAMSPAIFQSRPNDFAFFSPTAELGVCQACHTDTNHFRNNGLGPDQDHSNMGFAEGFDCTTCHTHENGFTGHGDGCGSEGSCHGEQVSHLSHVRSADEGGRLGIACNACHDINNFPVFADGQDLSATSVCDTCHSPNGTYDGVSDPAIGAKQNWELGVYVGVRLSNGREKWCAGCHDEEPSVILGVSAPNVIGDEDADSYYGAGLGYGYYKSGHGLAQTETYPASGGLTPGAGMLCTECHNSDMAHIDGVEGTYDASVLFGAPNDYQHGYRLKSVDGDIPMYIPRDPYFGGGSYRIWADVSHYRLCLKCHDSSQYLVGYDPESPAATFTNFFQLSQSVGVPNQHQYHVNSAGPGANYPLYDSDYDQLPDAAGRDSRLSCPACHNVHGSTYLAMIRDARLVEYAPQPVTRHPGTPTFYTNDDTVIPPSSAGLCFLPEDTSVSLADSTGAAYNGRAMMCGQCHGGCWQPWDRTPVQYAAFNDSDGDGVMDSTDNCPVDFQLIQDDSDGDGLGDACDPCLGDPSNVNDPSTDTDADGIGNNCDVCPNDPLNDPDGDGVCEADTCPLDDLNDIDGDGVCGDIDVCPLLPNAGQADADADGFGDICDNCPSDYNPGQEDTVTGDGTGDACGPGIVTLHPSGVVDGTQFKLLGRTPWEDALDSNDGDRSIAYNFNVDGELSTVSVFSVSMDDTAGTFLEGKTITGLRIHTYARYHSAGSGIPTDGSIDVGYNTGTNTVWNGNYVFPWPDWDYSYTHVISTLFTTDSDGGSLDTTDIDNLQVLVQRNSKNTTWQMLVTEVYAEVLYE